MEPFILEDSFVPRRPLLLHSERVEKLKKRAEAWMDEAEDLREEAALLIGQAEEAQHEAEELEKRDASLAALVVRPFVLAALEREGELCWPERECLALALLGDADRNGLLRIGLSLGLVIPMELMPRVLPGTTFEMIKERRAA